MPEFRLQLELLSPTLVGSGEGFGAVIDADVVFDDLGLPYIPARRIKGCLREAAETVEQMLAAAGISFDLNIAETFGVIGTDTGVVTFANLTLAEYVANAIWLDHLMKQYGTLLSPEAVLEVFTELRQQTAIDDEIGIAQKHSLRTVRVLTPGLTFVGEVRIDSPDPAVVDTLALACLNLRRIGTKRNRGYGDVACCLIDPESENPVPVLQKLEGCENG